MSRRDKKEAIPTAEQTILSSVSATPLRQWHPGKKFLCSDNRISYILETENPGLLRSNIKDSVIKFVEVRHRLLPDGKNQAVIVFTLNNKEVLYPTGKEMQDALDSFTSKQLPMLIDLDMVAEAKNILQGMSVYTRSPLWYQGDSTRITGKRYVPVIITDVSTGVTTFPLKVSFHDDSSGMDAFMFMNFGSSGFDSRSFSNLFSLDNIRNNYPKISDEVWENICNSRVALGMTKEECKLALGNPSEVAAGHDYSQTLDIWQYSDGSILRFADGLLVSFRH